MSNPLSPAFEKLLAMLPAKNPVFPDMHERLDRIVAFLEAARDADKLELPPLVVQSLTLWIEHDAATLNYAMNAMEAIAAGQKVSRDDVAGMKRRIARYS